MLIEWQPRHSTSVPDTIIPPACRASSQTDPDTFPLTIRALDSQSNLKRIRPQSDVEGEDLVDIQRKKRRLRVDLVTSRLSQPYASPATHINSSRRTQRLGPWARPRFRVRSPLRRAAILNSIRIRRTTARDIGHKEANLLTTLRTETESDHVEIDLVTEGIRTPREPSPKGCLPQGYTPPLPSPLGPSNYDAFDEEEDQFGEDDMESDEKGDDVYSNFNDLGSTDDDVEDYDSLSPFSGDTEDYSRPPKDGPTADDTKVKAGTGEQVERLPGLHGV
ncbi:MAG: hypothetical protein LQ339_000158 [Xanthoria mediterranea]|nr:MAG: hypothetical protein LQ339_000158 [Xanthoria mediterranea]